MTWFIAAIFYLLVGVGLMVWIKRDNEFRYSEAGEILAYSAIVFWPVAALLWAVTRPPEQIEDLGAKKTYQDFKSFMRQRKPGESDLGAKLAGRTTPDKPLEIGEEEQPEFKDLHLEGLISKKEYMEALRTANDMLRFAREQQEHVRIEAYEKYIKEIKDKRRDDFVKNA